MKSLPADQRQNILVLGAGELGMAMLAGLVAERTQQPQAQLSVLLRPASLSDHSRQNQARLKQLADWQVTMITGDFSRDDEAALAVTFRRYDVVINCSGFVGGPGTQLKISRAVLAAGVARYFPWQFGVDYDRIGRGSGQPVWDEQLAVRELLRAQRQTAWTIVSTGMFTSFLFEPTFGLVDFALQQVNAPGSAGYALTVTTPEDIGRLTAKILFSQPSPDNRVIYVAGDTVTYDRLTTLLSEHFQRPFRLRVISHQALTTATASNPDDVAAAYRLAFARPDGVAWHKAQSWNAQQAIPVTDVRGWLTVNRPVN